MIQFIQGESGTGKTSILRILLKTTDGAGTYFDCSQKLQDESGHCESSLVRWFQAGMMSKCKLFLIDNVDFNLSYGQQAMSDTLMRLIDGAETKAATSLRIIATCTNLSLLNQSVLHRYGPPICLQKLSSDKRKLLFKQLIEVFPAFGFASIGDRTNEISVKLTETTQGFSVPEIIAMCRDEWHTNQIAQSATNVPNESAPRSDVESSPQGAFSSLFSKRSNLFFDDVADSRGKHDLKQHEKSLTAESSTIQENDVLIGVDHIKGKLMSRILDPYEDGNIAEYTALGIRPCTGVLISGPPGSGKTSIAKWLMHAGRRKFRSMEVSCADLVHKVVGESEQRLAALFARARDIAPCFLLLDNLEIILGSNVSQLDDQSHLHQPVVNNDGNAAGVADSEHATAGFKSIASKITAPFTASSSLSSLTPSIANDVDGHSSNSPATSGQPFSFEFGSGVKESKQADMSVPVFTFTGVKQQPTKNGQDTKSKKKSGRSNSSGSSSSSSSSSSGSSSSINISSSSSFQSRSTRTSHAALDRLLSSLLVEIDGLRQPESLSVDSAGTGFAGVGARKSVLSSMGTSHSSINSKPVIVIATTSKPQCLDRALTRPGRLEEHIHLQLPNLEQRQKILHQLAQGTMLAGSAGGPDGTAGSSFAADQAVLTTGWSPAELKVLVQEAAMDQLRRKIMLLRGGEFSERKQDNG